MKGNRATPNPPSPPGSDDLSSLPKLNKGKEHARDDSQEGDDDEDGSVDLEEGDFGSLSFSPQEIREQRQVWKSIKTQKLAEIQCENARKAYEWQQKCREEDNEEALGLRDGDKDGGVAQVLEESMMEKYHPPNQFFRNSTGKPPSSPNFPEASKTDTSDIGRPHVHKEHSPGQAANLYHHSNILVASAEPQEFGNDDEAENIPQTHHDPPTVTPQANPSSTSASRVVTPSSPVSPSRPRRPDQQRYTHPHRRLG